MNEILQKVRGGLVVSCQAENGSPFNSPEGVWSFARCAEIGGASAIRSCGVEKTAYLIKNCSLPVIGLTKSYFEDGYVRITGSFEEVDSLVAVSAPVIAIDGTFRRRSGGLTGPEFICEIKCRYKNIVLMADISTVEEAQACRNAGADCVSTTLCGYTPLTREESFGGPSLQTLQRCVEELPDCPVFAEGRYNTPEEAVLALHNGAWAVVVGSAITRPHLVTEWFVSALHREKEGAAM